MARLLIAEKDSHIAIDFSKGDRQVLHFTPEAIFILL